MSRDVRRSAVTRRLTDRARRALFAALVVLVVGATVGAVAVGPAVAQWESHANGPGNAGAAPNATALDDVQTSEYATPGGDVASEPAVTANGTIVAAGDAVVAYDENGTERWSRTLGGTITGTPAVTDARVFVVADDALTALDRDTGAVAWTRSLDGAVSGSVTVADGVVYAATANGTLSAHSTVGQALWTYDAGASLATTTPSVANGSVYVGAADGTLHAVAAADGASQWTDAASATGARLTTPVVADGAIYVAGANGTVASYDATGTQTWRATVPADVAWAPTIAGDRIVVASTDGTISALASNGTTAWTATVPSTETIGPQLSAGNGTVFVGTDAGEVVGLAAADGDQQWATDVDGTLVTPVALSDDAGYLGTSAGVVIEITPDRDESDDGGDEDDGDEADDGDDHWWDDSDGGDDRRGDHDGDDHGGAGDDDDTDRDDGNGADDGPDHGWRTGGLLEFLIGLLSW